MIGIYKITSPSGKIYIGQSINIESRFDTYIKKQEYSTQTRLKRSFDKYGVTNHIFEVLEQCEIDSLNCRERYYQDKHNVLSESGLNCRLTTSKTKSGRNSIESNKKRSVTMKGRNRGPRPDVAERNKIVHTGKSLSADHIESIKKAQTEKTLSADHIEKLRKVNKRPKTADEKSKFSAAWDTKEYIQCPHCNITSKNMANLTRWHFDNCKYK